MADDDEEGEAIAVPRADACFGVVTEVPYRPREDVIFETWTDDAVSMEAYDIPHKMRVTEEREDDDAVMEERRRSYSSFHMDPVLDRFVPTRKDKLQKDWIRGMKLNRDARTDVDSGLPPNGNMITKHMAGAEQFTTIVQENDMEAFMSLEDSFVEAYPHGESPWRLLHIVAVYGTAEMVDCIKRWTRIDWDRQHTIPKDLFKLALQFLNVKEATALYLATFCDRKEIVKSLVKLAGEDSIQLCLRELPISNEMEHVYMLELANRLRQKHADLKPTIVPGHQRNGNGTQSRVFIVYSVSVVKAKDYDFNGLGIVKLRNPYVIKKKRTLSPICEKDLSNDDTQRVREAIQTHRDRLWLRHSNLNIITGRQAKTNLNGSVIEEPCVVLYCSTKGVIPLGEDEFPRRLSIQNDDHINVIVREGFFDFGVYKSLASTWPHPTLKMGCEIGRLTPQFDPSRNRLPSGGGTLGPFVRYNDNIGFLTCAHVLFNIPSPLHTIDLRAVVPEVEVVQPSTDSTFFGHGKPCGVVERVVFDPNRIISIDAAVVKITDPSREPSAGQFSNTHHSCYRNAEFDELPEYNSNSMLTSIEVNDLQPKPNVVKFGSRTDVTRGALSVVGTDVRPYSTELGLPNNIGKVLMKNQYLVTGIYPFKDFVDGGDSGSAVFCKDKNGQLQCVGMAIGYCDLDDFPHQAGIVTPIDALLQALGPDIKLATFP